jgi:hypothetical protein
MIVVCADWKIGFTDRFKVGTCSVDVSKPYDHMSFSRGFPLHTLTHQRCALFSLILGLELVDGNVELLKSGSPVAIATKSRWVIWALARCKKWRSTGKWPKGSGLYRNMLTRVDDLVASLPPNCKLVLADVQESQEVELDKYVDKTDEEARLRMEELRKKGGDPRAEVATMMRERKMSEIMLQKALQSGARIEPVRKK